MFADDLKLAMDFLTAGSGDQNVANHIITSFNNMIPSSLSRIIIVSEL